MMRSISDTSKGRGRGRPSTGGQMQGIMLRMPAEQIAELDIWIAEQPDPKPTRPEAIRRILGAKLRSRT